MNTPESNKKGIIIPSLEQIRRALSVVYADAWAEDLKLKVDADNYNNSGREYIIQIMRDNHDHIVIPKAAQMGVTIAMIMISLYRVIEKRWHGLYLFPKKQGANQFVQGRVDQIILSNPDLAARFTSTDNVKHKQTSDGVNLYFRGTNIITELREIPVDFEIWDERDVMVEENLTEALARMDGSKIRKLIEASTPTAPGHGVDSDDAWRISDMHRWFVPCPHCSRFQVLNFQENVFPWLGDKPSESELHCAYCKKQITDEQRWGLNSVGEWRATNLEGELRGYHISQLNSPVKKFVDFIRPYHKGQYDAQEMRAFYNNNLGEPYIGFGDQFTPEMMDACRTDTPLRSVPDGPIYVGVDTGNSLHVKAAYLDRQQRAIAWDIKVLRNWKELYEFLSGLHNFMCVIDANPEKTKAGDLAAQFPGKIYLAFAREQYAGAEMATFSPKKRGEVPTATFDKTMAMDTLIARYQKGPNPGGMVLPPDARFKGEELRLKDWNGFYQHHFELVRVEEEDIKLRKVARWKKNRNPDHFHHADMFCEIAFLQRPKLSIPANIMSAFQQAGGLVKE